MSTENTSPGNAGMTLRQFLATAGGAALTVAFAGFPNLA
jgi:hypothetical protein